MTGNDGLSAQNSGSPEFSTIGTEFVLSFGQNWRYQLNDYKTSTTNLLAVRIAAAEAAKVTFTFKGDNSSATYDVAAGAVRTVLLNDKVEQVYSNRPLAANNSAATRASYENKSYKSLYITSDKPIAVYALNSGGGSADATNVLPVDNLGTTYYHISYPAASHYQDGGAGATNEIYGDYANYDGYTIVSVHDGTIVTEKLTTGGTRDIPLSAGQVYSFYTGCRGSLSGTYITSNYPIAYFTTNSGTRLPNNVNNFNAYQATECLYQQLAPVSAWGSKYVVPVSARGKERVRIMISAGTQKKPTVLKINGQTSLTSVTGIDFPTVGADSKAKKTLSSLLPGDYVDLEITAGCYIESNFPIGVCAFMMGNEYLKETMAQAGDPSMSWIPALEQSVKSTNIAVFYKQGYVAHKAVIVVKNTEIASTTVGIGVNPPQQLTDPGNFTAIQGCDYSYYSYDVSPDYDYTFANPAGLVVLGYGYGSSESYYYLAGAANRIINPHFTVNDVHYQEAYGTAFCPGDEVIMKASISSRYLGDGAGGYEKGSLTWFVDDVRVDKATDSLQWQWDTNLSPGNYKIKMVVKNITGNNDVCETQLTIKDNCQNLWIGGDGAGRNTIYPDSPTKNSWGNIENWTLKKPPGESETVFFHEDALDLYVDDVYKVVAIDATNSKHEQGLRILKNASLELTEPTTPLNLGNGELYIEAGGPGKDDKNGSFITQRDISITGTVQVFSHAKNLETANNKYNPDDLSWQYLGIPVRGSITGAFFSGAMVRRYSERADNSKYWIMLSQTEQMDPWIGYELAWLTPDPGIDANGYFEFTGSLLNSDNTLTLSRTSGALFSGYHVLGNPYTAGLKINGGLTFGQGMEQTVYLYHTGSSKQWDKWAAGLSGDGEEPGQYIAVPQALAGTGKYLPETVSSMQGFVVKVIEGAGSSLTFNYDGVKQNTERLRSDILEPDLKTYTLVTLGDDYGQHKDRVWLFTEKQATRKFDNGYDGRKLFGQINLSQLYAAEEDGKYQVDAVPDINNTYLAFKAEEGVTEYTLTFSHQNMWSTYTRLNLIDLQKDTQALIDITRDGSTYSFTAYNTDVAENRFKIVTETGLSDIDEAETCGFDAYYLNNDFVLSNCEKEVAVSVYTITGKMVYTTLLQSYQTKYIDKQLAAGVYVVQAQYPGNRVTKKVIVW